MKNKQSGLQRLQPDAKVAKNSDFGFLDAKLYAFHFNKKRKAGIKIFHVKKIMYICSANFVRWREYFHCISRCRDISCKGNFVIDKLLSVFFSARK